MRVVYSWLRAVERYIYAYLVRYILVGKKESYQVGLDEVERFKLGVYSDSA